MVPHIGRTIDSTVEAINAGLQSLKSGRGTVGKVAVTVMQFFRMIMKKFGDVGEDEIDIQTALREALSNAVIHGNRENPCKRVMWPAV